MGESTEPAIWLDERMRNRLGLKDGQEVEFSFRPVWLVGQTCWAWNASDPAYRVAARLAVLSLALGVIGLILGILSLWLTLRPV